MKHKKLFIYIISSCFAFAVNAQNNDELLAKGIKYKNERNLKEGFPIFQKLLKSDSANAQYVINASYFYTKVGNTLTDETARLKYFNTASYLAKKAIVLDDKNAESHYVYAMALGRINEFASSKQKIANSKLIKSEIDETLKLNPLHAGAYHILGRWNRTIAGFGAIEKMAINTMYGGVPKGATYEGAVKAFTQAMVNEPNFKLHQFELAQTYYDMGKKINAKIWLEKALAEPANDEENKSAEEKCKQLLDKINR
jgi:tetratricopeptide (TPR) repeat protein